MTVYVIVLKGVNELLLPYNKYVEYVIEDDISMLPHPNINRNHAIQSLSERLETHDIVHSYCSKLVPALKDLETETVVTLNAYGAVCPKEDAMYPGERKCTGPGKVKFPQCILSNQ